MTSSWVAAILAFAVAHPQLLGFVVFLAAASEAIVLVGALVPGTALILAIAGIVGAAHGPVMALVLWATAGAIVSDGLSFWIGHRYGSQLRNLWPFRNRPELLEAGERFFARHGGKSVFLARFLPGVRAVVPVVAGMVGMSLARFYFANVGSAVVWAVSHILPAAGVGIAFEQLRQMSARLVLLVLLALLLGWLALRLVRLLVLRLLPGALALYARADGWLRERPQPALRRLGALLDPAHPAAVAVLFWLAVGLLATYGLLAVFEDVLTGDPLVRADRAISNLFQALRTPAGDRVMVFVTMLGDGALTLPLMLLGAVTLLLEGARRSLLALLLAQGGAALLVPLVKWLVQRPRPLPLYEGFDAFAFPSGHATFATVTYGCLTVILARGLPMRARLPIYTAAALLALAIGISRIYLAAHWPSDVLAGWLLGLVVTAAFALVAERLDRRPPRRLLVRLLPVVALPVLAALHLHLAFATNLERYAARPEPRPMAIAAWWQDGYRHLPQHRMDLFGESEEPILLQWAGTPASLARRLVALGWRPAPTAFTLARTFGFLRPDAPLDALPPLPTLHQGARPLAMFWRPRDPESRLVLRLWPSRWRLVDTQHGLRVYLGSLTLERVWHPYGIVSLLREEPPMMTEIARFTRELAETPPRATRCREQSRDAALPPLLLCAPATARLP